jgi:hypothetical protein
MGICKDCEVEVSGSFIRCFHCNLKYKEEKTKPFDSKIKRKCKMCGKTLALVGDARKNGKMHQDWNTRDYHKSCYKEHLKYDD